MGSQVEGVPQRPEVDAARRAQAHSFGVWLRRERELRGISVWFVAARTKLPPAQVRAIETGETPLLPDSSGRALARALASAIGADPEAAATRLGRPQAAGPKARSRTRLRARLSPLRLGAFVGVVLLTALGFWLLQRWIDAPGLAAQGPAPVYRPDYVGRLVDP